MTRMRLVALVALGVVAACSLIDPLDGLSDNFGKTDGGAPDAGDDAHPQDAGSDRDASDAGPPPPCDLTKHFMTPVPLLSVNTAEDEGSARLTADEQTLFIDAVRDGDGGNPSFDLFMTKRDGGGDTFGPLIRLVPPDDPSTQEYSGSMTDDGLLLFFERQPIAGLDSNILFAKRTRREDPFDPPQDVPGINSAGYDANPFVRGDGGELWFVANGQSASIDIYVAHANPNDGGPWTTTTVGEVNTSQQDFNPVISADGLTLYFASDRNLPGSAGLNIFVASRSDTKSVFQPPQAVDNVNSNDDETPTWLSVDGCRLYMTSNRAGGRGKQDIYVATRPK
jgi:hypothetical protein